MVKKREVAVQFVGYSDNATKSLSLKVEFDRGGEGIDAEMMEANFCGSRLEVILEYQGGGDNEGGQQTLQDERHTEGPVVCECKQHTTKPGVYSVNLNFLTEDVDIDNLRTFKGKSGTISYKRIGDAGEESDGQPTLPMAE